MGELYTTDTHCLVVGDGLMTSVERARTRLKTEFNCSLQVHQETVMIAIGQVRALDYRIFLVYILWLTISIVSLPD